MGSYWLVVSMLICLLVFFSYPAMNCQLSTINCPLSTIQYELSITNHEASTRVEGLSSKKTMLPRVWKLCQVKKQYFHACGRSVQWKNTTSTRVEGPSSKKTELPHAWKLCYLSFVLARLTETYYLRYLLHHFQWGKSPQPTYRLLHSFRRNTDQ